MLQTLPRLMRWLRRRLPTLGLLFILSIGFSGTALAQNAVNGRVLYESILVPGHPSCSSGGCHGPDPSLRQNKIHFGDTPAAIAYAIATVSRMAFLRGRLSEGQLADLAAYIANPAAGRASPAIQITPQALDFGNPWLGTITASKKLSIQNTGQAELQLDSLQPSSPAFSLEPSSSCVVGQRLAPGQSCELDLRYRALLPGTASAQLLIAHNAAGGPSNVPLTGSARPLPPETRLMVEYRFAPLNYYFITSRASEQQLLDGINGFERTGESFPVYIMPATGLVALSRYFFDQVARNNSRGSHFYTAIDAEKDLLLSLNPSNQAAPRLPFNEGIDSYVRLPSGADAAATCSIGFQPVWRLFRGQARFPDDPNHRFVVRRELYDEFVAAGWDGEDVRFCVPIQ